MRIEPGRIDSHPYDFEAIEAAVRETERGRWFLAEYERRNRSAEIKSVLQAIERFEAVAKPPHAKLPAIELQPKLAEAIRETKMEIEALQTKSQACVLLRGSSTFAQLTVQASCVAAELMQLGNVAQLTAESHREDPAGMAGAMTHMSQRLLDIVALQNQLTAAVGKVVSLLAHLDRETTSGQASIDFASRLEKLLTDSPRLKDPLSEDNIKYFGKDEELFVPEPPGKTEPITVSPPVNAELSCPALPNIAAPAGMISEEKARIVVVRTPCAAAKPIPLAESLFDASQTTAA
jgi:hypothetical protein